MSAYAILGTPPEASFTRLARLAQRMFGVEGALLGFLGERRVYYKAHVGLATHSFPRAQSLCAHAAFSDALLIVPDVQDEPLLASLEFVQRHAVRFYVGAPLKNPDGVVLGTLELIGSEPGTLNEAQQALLVDIVDAVMELLEVRRQSCEQQALAQQHAQSRTAQAQLTELLEAVPYYALSARADGRVSYANRALMEALELDTLPDLLSDLYSPEDREALAAAFNEALSTGQSHFETRLVGPQGRRLPVAQMLFTHLRRGSEAPSEAPSVSVIARNLSAQQQRERLETQRTDVLELTARGAPLPAVLLQLGRFLEANALGAQAAISVLREGRLQLEVAPTLPSAFTRMLEDLPVAAAGGSGVAARTGERVLSLDVRHDETWFELRYYALQHGLEACWSEPILSEQGGVLGVFALYLRERRGPSELELRLLREAAGLAAIAISRQLLYHELERAAYTDLLTNLPNRRRLTEYMTRALAQAAQRGGVLGALMLDLDEFKQVNDSLGHGAGDLLLQEVALRLQSCLPEGASVGRSGGDEFVFIVPLGHPDKIAELASNVTHALQAPFVVQGRSFSIGASMGVSLYPEDAEDAEALLKTADSAMHAAKGDAKAGSLQGYRRYHPEMTEMVTTQLRLGGELRRALLTDELRLFTQPRFELARGRFTAFEALVRWQHPERGLLTPESFLPVAEKAGLLPQLDYWVLEQVVQQLGRWREAGRTERLSFNVSASSFQSPDFVAVLGESLSKHNVPASQLEAEITENLLMQDLQGAAAQLHALKAAFPGLRVAIDDFGSGYSSLAYLRYLPVDTLKIDRAFIQDLDHSSATQQRTALAVIRTIVALGRDLDFRIVAEGAETEAQLKMLTALGVDEVQGYLLGKPQPLSEVMLESSSSAVLREHL